MTYTCPNCGKPVRPGSRFCGRCGSSLEIEKPISDHRHQSGSTCPHCGKSVRTDAKFCSNCGRDLSPGTSPPQTRALTPEDSQAPKKHTSEEVPPPVETPPIVETSQSPQGTNRSLVLVTIILSIMVIALAGYIAWDVGLFGSGSSATPTPTLTLIAPTPSVKASETIAVNLPAPTITPQASSEPSVTASPTGTSPPTVIIDENFYGDLQSNWTVWGSPLPQVRAGLGNYLELEAGPRSAGITSIASFALQENIQIKFDTSLPGSEEDLLSLDFDPKDNDRQPGSAPGPVHLDLGINQLRLVASSTPVCVKPLPEQDVYRFILHFNIDGLSLWLDNEQLCQPSIVGLPLDQVRLSFSGRGRLDNIMVTQQ